MRFTALIRHTVMDTFREASVSASTAEDAKRKVTLRPNETLVHVTRASTTIRPTYAFEVGRDRS